MGNKSGPKLPLDVLKSYIGKNVDKDQFFNEMAYRLHDLVKNVPGGFESFDIEENLDKMDSAIGYCVLNHIRDPETYPPPTPRTVRKFYHGTETYSNEEIQHKIDIYLQLAELSNEIVRNHSEALFTGRPGEQGSHERSGRISPDRKQKIRERKLALREKKRKK
ncbi:MAG: hypothetical protein LBR22_03895 [Desulfovibrio sp.]|jgi:hypothetical protein|nr:hypothetical protein [Desulfovibrio sp.]